MKKILALMMTLCMLALTVPAMAETGGDEGGLGALLGALSGGLEEGDLEGGDGLLGLMEKLGDGSDEKGEGGSVQEAVKSLLTMLKLFGGGAEAEMPAYTTVAANGIEQFYGVWTFARANLMGIELTPELAAMLGLQVSGHMTIEADKLTLDGAVGDIEKSYAIAVGESGDHTLALGLTDGALDVKVDGESFLFHLTDAGELVCADDEVGAAFFPAEPAGE